MNSSYCSIYVVVQYLITKPVLDDVTHKYKECILAIAGEIFTPYGLPVNYINLYKCPGYYLHVESAPELSNFIKLFSVYLSVLARNWEPMSFLIRHHPKDRQTLYPGWSPPLEEDPQNEDDP